MLRRKKQVTVHYAIQTNGMVINDKWCRFLKEHRFSRAVDRWASACARSASIRRQRAGDLLGFTDQAVIGCLSDRVQCLVRVDKSVSKGSPACV